MPWNILVLAPTCDNPRSSVRWLPLPSHFRSFVSSLLLLLWRPRTIFLSGLNMIQLPRKQTHKKCHFSSLKTDNPSLPIEMADYYLSRWRNSISFLVLFLNPDLKITNIFPTNQFYLQCSDFYVFKTQRHHSFPWLLIGNFLVYIGRITSRTERLLASVLWTISHCYNDKIYAWVFVPCTF